MKAVCRGCILVLFGWLAGCEPVAPLVTYDDWQFEGYQVYSYVPAKPTGLVFLFHGSYGSAEFARKIETVDVINELVSRGYGFVATDSAQRTGPKRWRVDSASLSRNPDLARLERLYEHLLYQTGVSVDTPLYGIGMSNGARMVSLWGQAMRDAGYPVAAVAPFMGAVATPVRRAGGLTVPAYFVMAANDTVAGNDRLVEDVAQAIRRGTDTVLRTKGEEPLLSARFTRVPAIDAEGAEAVYRVLLATGAWDESGTRVLSLAETAAAVQAIELPPELVRSRREIRNQVSALLALHQFVGLFKVDLVNFFDRHRDSWRR